MPRVGPASPTSSRRRAPGADRRRRARRVCRPHIGGLETLERVIVVTAGSCRPLDKPTRRFSELLASAHRSPRSSSSPREPASILFTGGTTGPPKGVVLSHSHNLNVAQGAVERFGYTEDDVLYSVFPLFHANAKYMSVLTPMVAGARLVIDRRFSASRFWDICAGTGHRLQRPGRDAADPAQAGSERQPTATTRCGW